MEKQKRRIIYMTDKQWKEIGKTAKETELVTISYLVRKALREVGYTK